MNNRLSLIAKHIPAGASVAVGIVPIIILIVWFDVSRKVIGIGALSYVAGAMVIKFMLYDLFVVKFLHKKLSNKWLAVSQGVVSAFSELSAALCFFLFVVPRLTFAELIGFGLSAGSVEAIILPFMK
ncbi:MAG: hypothetical protein AB1298_09995, partial [Bacteroidota bacterium]